MQARSLVYLAAATIGCTWLLLLEGCGEESAPEQTAPQEEAPAKPLTLGEYRAKIGEDAVFDAPRSYYPKLYAKLGGKRYADAMELNDWAALQVVMSPDCDELEVIDISDAAARAKLRWFADCKNGQRFYVSEDEAVALKARLSRTPDSEIVTAAAETAATPESAKLANFDEARAVTECDLLMKGALQSPGSYKSAWSWTATPSPINGRVRIVRSFRARNAFNAELQSEYDCLVDAATNRVIELKFLDRGTWQVVGG